MARARRTNKWKNLSVQLDERLYDKLKDEATKEHRSLVSTLEIILENHFTRANDADLGRILVDK